MSAFRAYCSNFHWLLIFVVSFDSLCSESDNKPFVTPEEGRVGRVNDTGGVRAKQCHLAESPFQGLQSRQIRNQVAEL